MSADAQLPNPSDHEIRRRALLWWFDGDLQRELDDSHVEHIVDCYRREVAASSTQRERENGTDDRPCRCGHPRWMHYHGGPPAPCARCDCVDFSTQEVRDEGR